MIAKRTKAEIEADIALAKLSRITLPAQQIYPGDLMDRALDKLRTVHLALAPDNKGWQDDDALQSIWGMLAGIICDLEPVRNQLQGCGPDVFVKDDSGGCA